MTCIFHKLSIVKIFPYIAVHTKNDSRTSPNSPNALASKWGARESEKHIIEGLNLKLLPFGRDSTQLILTTSLKI
jgi:hypothetical protein